MPVLDSVSHTYSYQQESTSSWVLVKQTAERIQIRQEKQINTATALQPGAFRNQMTDKSPKFRLQITVQDSNKKNGEYTSMSPNEHPFNHAGSAVPAKAGLVDCVGKLPQPELH